MEGLTISTNLPPRRSSKSTPLSPSSAWSTVSKPFQSRPKLSSGVMSSWIEKQNDNALAQNRRIFYVPGLTSKAKSSEAAYTQLPRTDKWSFKGIPVLTVNTHMPQTGSELDLRTEIDFWDTIVLDKSPRPKEAEIPVVVEQPEVLFDANEDSKEEKEVSDDGLTHTNKLKILTPRTLSLTEADHTAETECSVPTNRMVFQPQNRTNPYLSRTQSRRVLLSKAWSCCGITSRNGSEGNEKS